MKEPVIIEEQQKQDGRARADGHPALLRRKCACSGAGDSGITGNCTDCDGKRLSRQTRHASPAGPSRAPEREAPPHVVDEVLASSSGRPLDAATRDLMESRLGHDFGSVRVHTDARAAASAEAVNALAYTVGQQVVFAAGQYRPETPVGRRLLAHELAHTVQQGEGGGAERFDGKLEVGSPDSADEREADRAAEAVESPAGFGPKPLGKAGGSPLVLRRKTGNAGSWLLGLLSSFIFGTTVFPDSWLQEYLRKLDETGDIEGDPDSDDKAREIVNTWRQGGSKFVLTARRKALLIKEMLDGPTLWGDEAAILELLERSYNYELSYIFKEGGITAQRLGEDISGSAGDRLREFYEYRFEGGASAVHAGEIRPTGEPFPLGQELPPVGAQSYIKQYFSDGTTGWNVPCVLGILCTKDRAIIEELPALNVKRLDRIDVMQWVFDGTSWNGKLVHPIGVNRPKDKLVALVSTSSCSTAAQTMYHEVHHQHQPAKTKETVFTMEVDAYTEAEKWAIERGLPEQPTDLDSPPLRERGEEGKPQPSAEGIEGKVRKIYGGPTPEPGGVITGHTDPNKTKVETPTETKERESIPGETYLKEVTDFSKVKPIDAEEWKCPDEKPKDNKAATLQRSAKSPDVPDTVPPVVHEVLDSPGQPLDAATRDLMESHFGHDFGRVRVHADARAAAAATSVNAHAYTVGHNVVFGQGQYSPTTNAGMRLLAHELAHVVQQGSASSVQRQPLSLGEPGDEYEREAEQAAVGLTTAPHAPPTLRLAPPRQGIIRRFSTSEHIAIGEAAYLKANPRNAPAAEGPQPASLDQELVKAFKASAHLKAAKPSNIKGSALTAGQAYGIILAEADNIASLELMEDQDRERAGKNFRVPVLSRIWDFIEDKTHMLDLASRNREHFHPHNFKAWQAWHWAALREMDQAHKLEVQADEIGVKVRELMAQFSEHDDRARRAVEGAPRVEAEGRREDAARLDEIAMVEVAFMQKILAQIEQLQAEAAPLREKAKALATHAVEVSAFGDHFLTDAYSGGHIVTPRADLIDDFSTRLLGLKKLEGVLHCGSVPSLAWHDLDNKFGVMVKNRRGDVWRTYGDNYLEKDKPEPKDDPTPEGETMKHVVEATARSVGHLWKTAAGHKPDNLSDVLELLPAPNLDPAIYPAWTERDWEAQLSYSAGLPTEHVPNEKGDVLGLKGTPGVKEVPVVSPLVSFGAACLNALSAFSYQNLVVPMLARIRAEYAKRFFTGSEGQVLPETATPQPQASVRGHVVVGSLLGALAGAGLGFLAGGVAGAIIGGIVGLLGGGLIGGFIGKERNKP